MPNKNQYRKKHGMKNAPAMDKQKQEEEKPNHEPTSYFPDKKMRHHKINTLQQKT